MNKIKNIETLSFDPKLFSKFMNEKSGIFNLKHDLLSRNYKYT